MRKKVSLLSGVVLATLMLPVLAQSGKAPVPLQSGKELGKILPPFHPLHVVGPDKEKTVCPV